MVKEVLVAGNLKANSVDARSWFIEFEKHMDIQSFGSKGIVLVCPSFVELHDWQEAKSGSLLALGAQDISAFPPGEHTGDVSGEMLKPFEISYVIIGHSERRALLGETDQLVSQKIAQAFAAGLTPIVCVGETAEQREEGQTQKTLEEQLKNSLQGLRADQLSHVIVAYEPRWAIGTGKSATKEDAQDAAAFIKEAAGVPKVLYGGSVKPENVAMFIAQPHIDGVLVGGASKTGDVFGQLAHNAFSVG